jgi:hypothetical protein
MISLILTVLSIALLSAIAVISISYMPHWSKEQGEVASQVRKSSQDLERAFHLYALGHSDTPAAVISGDADGGLAANFTSFLGFLPPAIPGYQWVYGNTGPAGASGYQNTSYFCMKPQVAGGSTGEGKVRGITRAKLFLSDEQAFMGTNCGEPTNVAFNTFPAPMTFTYFVRYVPGARP